jgi:AmiR/NasT family two-component response regulator
MNSRAFPDSESPLQTATRLQAKGILMERHSLDEEGAFELIREFARRNNRKVVEVAGSITESQTLLSPPRPARR